MATYVSCWVFEKEVTSRQSVLPNDQDAQMDEFSWQGDSNPLYILPRQNLK